MPPSRHLTPLLALAAGALLLTPGCFRQTVLEADELALVRRAAPLGEDANLIGPDGFPRVTPSAVFQFQRADGTCTRALHGRDLRFNDVGVFYDNPDIGQDDVSHAYVSGLTPEDHVRLLERAPAGCSVRDDSPDAELVLVCPERMQRWLADPIVVTPENEDLEPYTRWVTQEFSGEWVFEIEGFRMPPRRGDDLAFDDQRNAFSREQLYETLAWSDIARARVFNIDELRSVATIALPPVLIVGLITAPERTEDIPAPDGLDWECAEEPFEANGSPLELQRGRGEVPISDRGATRLFTQEDYDDYDHTFYASFDLGLNPLAQDSIGGAATFGVRTAEILEFEIGLRHTLAAGLGEAADSYTHAIARMGLNLDLDPDRVFSLFLGLEAGVGSSRLGAARWGARLRLTEEFTLTVNPFNPISVDRLEGSRLPGQPHDRTLWISSAGVLWEF